MAYEYVLYEKKDRIAYITINRPESMNALHPDASREMREIFEDFRDDQDVWIAIVTGAGERAFCAGFDLKYAASRKDRNPAESVPLGGITRDWECWKPIIAAVNGYALGGGLELMLACDIAIAAEHAELGLPEVRVGLAPGAGGPHRLIRQIGSKDTLGLLLTGRRIPASEARRMGLVNEVVPARDLMATAERWAAQILEGAPLSVRAAKQMALEGAHLPYEEAMSRKYSAYEEARASADFIEGPRAFSEKRKPVWQGS